MRFQKCENHLLLKKPSQVMNHYLFERNARRRRMKAITLTFLIHLLLLAGIAYSGNVKLSDVLPDKIQELIGMDPAEDEATLPKP